MMTTSTRVQYVGARLLKRSGQKGVAVKVVNWRRKTINLHNDNLDHEDNIIKVTV